jgi:hypothetical protein
VEGVVRTTVGQLLVNDALPERYRDFSRVLDRKGLTALAARIAAEDPGSYRETMYRLQRTGGLVSHAAGASFHPRDLLQGPAASRRIAELRARVAALVNDDTLDDDQRAEAVRKLVVDNIEPVEDSIYEEGLRANSGLARQIRSGAKGGKADLRALVAGEMVVADHKNRVIPIPIMHGYAEGLDPAEFFAASYGTRKGQAETKLLVADAGFYGKKLLQAAHRQVVTERDCRTDGGIPVPASDPDNVGALLARDYGRFKAGTPVDANVARELGDSRIVVRSPVTCRASRGLCAACAGIRERGTLPDIGDPVGTTAALSISERVSQGGLSSKHGGGRASRETRADRLSGFPLIAQFIDMPGSFRDAAALAQVDGDVDSVSPAPQGGSYVTVGGQSHHVPAGFEVRVKPGQRVAVGQALSEGWVNPAEMTALRGIGAGRMAFLSSYRDALKAAGVRANRRNLEVVARGLLNHVEVTEPDGTDGLPGDVLEYGELESTYRPRYGFRVVPAGKAAGMYLEKPALYHTIGTRVTKDIADELEEQGVADVTVHADPPPFSPRAVRAMETSMRSPDWQVRLGGSYLRKGLLEAAQRGRSSAEHGTSFVPALMKAVDFGKDLKTKGVY